MLEWSPEQARRYHLFAVGLTGRLYPAGGAGIRRAFADLGSLQLDPLPVLGRNHDLVIQARVDGTHPDEALDLIHRERLGFEYWNKALCAISIERYPLFRRLMELGGEAWTRGRAEKLALDYPDAVDDVYNAVRSHGPLSSRELEAEDVAQGEHRGWKSTKAANAALEVLWNDGRLAVSHRVNYRRYFDLAERVIPSAVGRRVVPATAFSASLLVDRVRMAGLLPASGDAEVWTFVRPARTNGALADLLRREDLVEVRVAGIKTPFLALGDAPDRLAEAERAEPDSRVARFLAPLDPFLWARTAVERLWSFRYTWEVYKPKEKREFGYYVLPVLVGDRLVGRFDGALDRANGLLRVHAYHTEPGARGLDDPAVYAGFQRFLWYLSADTGMLPSGATWTREA
jgi:hypothetical protein